MRIVHTSDWHLGHRLGRVDRTEDLRRAVEQVAAVCQRERADVLLICGDLFSELNRTETLRQSVEHLSATFQGFLCGGGTILAITGNHDNENFCQVLRQAMTLAAPAPTKPGDQLPSGRFYLFSGPTFLRLADRTGCPVQFVMMPSPTASRYLDELAQRYQSAEERNRALKLAFTRKLKEILRHRDFQRGCQTVLAAHIITCGAEIHSGACLSEAEAVVLDDRELPTGLAYVALGDIHRPQCLMDLPHVRYSGSIERMDLGEAGEEKGLVRVDIGPEGRRQEPAWIQLEATPIYRVQVDDPPRQLPGLARKYPDRERALVNLCIRYLAGRDNLNDLLAELERIFPRWYDRDLQELGQPTGSGAAVPADSIGSFADTVRQYLKTQLESHRDRQQLLALAESLLAEEEP